MSCLVGDVGTEQYNIKLLGSSPFRNKDFSVLFAADLKIAAIFQGQCFDTVELSVKPSSFWLVCIDKGTQETSFFEWKYDTQGKRAVYKRSFVPPQMINQEEFRNRAKIVFKRLLNEINR